MPNFFGLLVIVMFPGLLAVAYWILLMTRDRPPPPTPAAEGQAGTQKGVPRG